MNRRLAGERCTLRANRRLGVRSLANWTRNERRSFDQLAPLVCLLSGLEKWSEADRADLVRFLRGKGAPSEVEVSRRARGMDSFRHALQELTAE